MSDENVSAQLEDRLSAAIEAASQSIRKAVRVRYLRGIAKELIYTDTDPEEEQEEEEEDKQSP